jgi:arylsulfatase A-like enzyme
MQTFLTIFFLSLIIATSDVSPRGKRLISVYRHRKHNDRIYIMMENSIWRKILWPLLIISFLVGMSCVSSGDKDSEIFRLIDNIGEDNVIQSPLKNIIEKFNSVEKDLTGEWVRIPELSVAEQDTWAASSGHPILGNDGAESAEGMELLENGRKLRYLSGGEKQKRGWRWLATAESLDLRSYPGFDKARRGVVLDGEHSCRFEKLCPEGSLILDLYFANPESQNPNPRVKVSFNGSDEEELVISQNKWYRIRKDLSLAKYQIEIGLVDRNLQEGGKNSVILGQVKMAGSSDIILLSYPRQQHRAAPDGPFVFRYYTYSALPEKKIRSVRPKIRYLYNLKNQFPFYDAGSGPNPYFLKKKIPFDEYSLNALIAPPESDYRVKLKIHPRSVLEFGYGILNEFPNRHSEIPFRFRVVLIRKGQETSLFDETVTWEGTKDIATQKISLDPYAGNDVLLSFQTSELVSEEPDQRSSPVVPLWINPFIYRIKEERQTNIILISLDTVRPDHLGCYGYPKNTSPAIDRLASDGVLFENTYSTTSWTLPAHISLLTSLNCLHHQVYFPLQKMDKGISTLADILRSRGFFCAAFTGGGYLSETYGFSKGFDSYQEIKLHGDQAIRLDEAERLADMASSWLENNKNKKFFLFLHTYQPHDPYANLSPLGKEFLDQNARWQQVKMETLFEEKGRFDTHFSEEEKHNITALYDGEIKYTDTAFVRPILDKLRELGLYDQSLIVLTSDHGEEFYEHESWLHDHSLYNETLKIASVIKFPGNEYQGQRIESISRITDFLPTVLDHLHIKGRYEEFDGHSLIPILEGKEKKPRTFVSDLALRQFDFAPTIISINQGNFKIILNKKIVSPYTKKMVRDFDGSRIELYDLQNDPHEKNNLAANIAYRDLCFELLDNINEIYEKAGNLGKERDEVTLDQSLRERLKALGYIK